MDSTLDKLIDTYANKDFEAAPQYFVDGDYLTIFTEDNDSYSDRIDDTLTLYRDDETNHIVGLKIKGVRALIADMQPRGLVVKAEGFELGILFISWAIEKQSDLQAQDIEILKYLQGKFGNVTATITNLADGDCFTDEHDRHCV